MKTFLQKLKSRKLWVCLIGAAGGIALACGVPDNIVTAIAGAATALVSVVAYIVVEGRIDAAAVELSSDFVNGVIEAVDAVKSKDTDK